ncbi:Nucleolar Complex 2 protein [Puccinia graminis f. sp. tritici]|uniref:Nucleolar Complex 2 protein n=1 Tax=Puccinia graminis f. sp. tritici TaxID=56615 RepID=A0A5B0PVJ6_PUCGR|nr:Nucleolar Complex 2 protein [Puccinia graminis f. sp. tritici]
MGSKKVSKQTKNFTRKHLTHTLTSRKKHQAKKKLSENRQHLKTIKRGNNNSKKKTNKRSDDEDDDDDDDDSVTESKPKMDMSVDALLNAQGLDSEQEGSDDGESDGKDEEDEDDDEDDDLESIGSLEDESGGKMDLEMLKEKDPEFYKFLEENDKGLLQFNEDESEEGEDEGSTDKNNPDSDAGSDQEEEDDDPTSSKAPKTVLLTKELLRTWQKAILENRSMRALRKLLLAFKSAAFSSSSNSTNLSFSIESSSVFNALITTTLRYLPVFLNQSLPARELPSGKFKIANNSKMYASMQRMLKSYFTSLTELVAQVPSQEKGDSGKDSMLHTAVSESAKLTPWIIGNRKIMKTWIKTLLELWSSSSDQVRVAAILSLRRIAVAADSTTMESIMKGVYTALIRSAKSTTVFTLPLINLMKNSASGLYLINTETSYPIVFSYIRQLAIHLRNSMKLKTKEGFQAVYNWQYIHSLDFWSLVLSSACEKNSNGSRSEPSALQPLIYPLVQITIGVIKLIPTSRYYPLRFHCIRLLLRLIQRTGTFIPLTPFLLDMIDSPLFKRQPTSTSLKALDWEYLLRCPKSHENSRVYADGVAEETSYLLLEYHACMSKSIGFPELVLPALTSLKKFSKQFNKHQRLVTHIKTLVEKLEANKSFVEDKRAHLGFGPKDRARSLAFLADLPPEKSPLGAHLRLQSKIRDQKRAALDRSAHKNIQVDDD